MNSWNTDIMSESAHTHKRSSTASGQLSIGLETIQQHTHLYLYQVFISGDSSQEVVFSLWRTVIRKLQDFLNVTNFAFRWSWHLQDQMLSSIICMFPQYMTYKHLCLRIRNVAEQFFPLMNYYAATDTDIFCNRTDLEIQLPTTKVWI